MKKNKLYIVFIFLIIVIVSIVVYNNRSQIYSKNLFYMDTYINIQLKHNNKNKVKKVFEEVEKIYAEYHQLTDRYNQYSNIINVYYINNNEEQTDVLTIDPKLYQIIEYSLNWRELSDGLFDIGYGNVIDIWKDFINEQTIIPKIQQLNEAKNNYKSIKLLGNNLIVNNNPNIDLGGIAKGYATDVVGEYLKSQSIKNYIINAGGQVLVGERKTKYKIGVKNPIGEDHLFIVTGNNISVATSGDYERFYEYDGKAYHHIIDPNTLYPSSHMKSVTVIADSGKLSDVLTTLLFVMPIEEGQKLIEEMPNVEALWYSNENEVIKSKGLNDYEFK